MEGGLRVSLRCHLPTCCCNYHLQGNSIVVSNDCNPVKNCHHAINNIYTPVEVWLSPKRQHTKCYLSYCKIFLSQLLTDIPPFSSSNLQLCSAAFCAHVMGEGRKQEPPCWFSMRQDKDRYPRTGGGCRWTSRPGGSRCWASSPCSYTGCRSWRHWMIGLVKKLSVAFNSY